MTTLDGSTSPFTTCGGPATALSSEDVDPLLVRDWGGWNDLETFLDHYRGTVSPEAQQRARDGFAWL